MINDLNILTECYIDTNLLETLVPPVRGYNHQKGCNTVANVMKKQLNDKGAIALIDNDKREINYIQEFERIANTTSLSLFKHRNKPHFIIRIDPAIDDFILKSAHDMDVDITSFGLPDSLKDFTKITKQKTSKSEPKFKQLFNKIKSAEEVKVLTKWVKYLKENIYNADRDTLRNMVSQSNHEI